jgi:G6PDH family F420-dependent oxidoreductase
MKIGYSLASEQFGPQELVDQARRARDAGFSSLAISDHFHPWNEAQGNSPFVWSVIGALSEATPELPVTTFVTCPILRIHPVIVAQAVATSSAMTNGRFAFGVGTGENLNEHVFGTPWPPADERLARLREAIELMRKLWTGHHINYEGRYYRAVNARIYTPPVGDPPVLVSAFGQKSAQLAVEVGDGLVTMDPSIVETYRSQGGSGPVLSAIKACFDADETRAVDIAHRMWGMELNPGQLNRELATPAMIESAASLVPKEKVAEEMPCGPDPERHIAALRSRAETGYDEVFVQQIGPDMDGFFDMYATKVLPAAA